MKSKSMLVVAALAGVPFIMVLGNSMLIPVLPTMQSYLNITQFQVSLIITLFSIPAGLTIPFAGFLSDRIGRKKVIVPSLIIYGLGGVIAAAAAILLKEKAYTVILGGRILQGIGAAGTAPIAMALVSDIFTSQERSKALGLIEAANGLGKVVSPILGSLVALIAWYTTFFVFPALIIPTALALWFIVKEPKNKKKPQQIKDYLNSVKTVFAKKTKLLLTCFLAGSVVLFVLFGVLFYMSDILEKQYKLDGVLKGLVLAIPVLALSTTAYLTGSHIKKKAKLMKWLVFTGLLLTTLSLIVIPVFKSNYFFFGAIVFMGIGGGLVLPCLNMIITSSTDSEERGMVTSLYGSVRFFGVALGPATFGMLLDMGKFITFISIAALAGISTLLAFFLIQVKDIKSGKKDETGGNKGTSNKKSKTNNNKTFKSKGLALRKPIPDKLYWPKPKK